MITFSEQRDIGIEQILPIYELNGWSSAQKPEALYQALLNSHALVSAWHRERLIGIGNAISDAINATSSVVWQILMDFPAYPDWNPFVRSIQGQAVLGAQLVARLQPPGGQAMTFKPTVLVADPEREFRWRGRFILPGLFDGEHRFQIEPLAENRVQFIHSEQFSGVLVPLLAKSLDTNVRQGFEAMNQALKDRAEARLA